MWNFKQPNVTRSKTALLESEEVKNVSKTLRRLILDKDFEGIKEIVRDPNEIILQSSCERLIHMVCKTSDRTFAAAKFIIEFYSPDMEVQDIFGNTPILIAGK